MLANRVLPPILPLPSPPLHPLAPPFHEPVPPIVTFSNIPRRYVKSSAQSRGEAFPAPAMEDTKKASRSLRKSSRINELRSTSIPTSNPAEIPISNGALHSPSDLSFHANRKRYASYDDESKNAEPADGHSPNDSRSPPLSTSSTGSGELSGHVCLCQPEPKIPRPRNAFILYRQHHQHEIVARHPGLANPEISKIIGERWKAESDESKRVWQDLAQLEKERHQEQYPDYRYQPRRVGKPGSLHINTQGHVTVDKYRCPRCGGRSIRTPTSPFVSSSGTPTLPPPNLSEGLTPTTRYLPMMSNLSLDSPARRRGPGPSNLSNIQISTSSSNVRDDTSMYTPTPLTPDSKRRRFNNYPVAGHSTSNARRDTPTPSYYPQQQQHNHQRRESLPPILMRHSPPNTAGLPPTSGLNGPAGPSNPPRTPRDLRRASVDLNLLVPASPQLQHHQHDQSRSVEAMVMSVPYHVKIKVLGRITPPLREAGPTSPGVAIRGAIIAVEGDEIDAVKELTTWLHDFLAKSVNEFRVKVEEAPKTPGDDQETEKEVGFETYLDLVREWHGKSREMIKFITTNPPPSSPSSTNSPSPPATQAEKEKEKEGGEVTPTSQPPPSSTSPKQSQTSTTDSVPPPLPVILLPTYQIHAANTYASRIPITDVYSPMDHWQWMATLWRGTVGPDLTIYVKSPHPHGGAGSNSSNSERGGTADVEMRDRGGWFKEAALRRVGFEVGEWVRGVGKTGGSASGGEEGSGEL
ncbi:hypothetical protein DM02DRAFT_513335 [Periconia macrospinosa]|uniref:HMG box domain-containing protein n=1 Tax=Periconia macrospinosa TaxID=97972 RepID=A0A2V1E9P5_9PLEO|nr:hypothetical protein DM02DRAFT_513335 [Periconia macrospinosa]